MNRRLWKDVSINSFVGFLTLGISFLFSLQIARILPIDDYGEYELKLSQAIILSLLIIFGTDQYASKLFNENNSLEKTNNKILSLRLFLFILIAIGVSVIKKEFLLPFLAVGITSFNLSYIFEIKDNNISFTNILLFEKLLFIIISLGFYFFKGNLCAENLFVFLLISNGISICIQFYKTKIDFKFEVPSIKEFIPCLFILVISLIDFINSGITKTIIDDKLTIEQVAIYSLALKFLMLGSAFQTVIDRIFRPKIIFEKVSNHIKNYIYFSTIPTIFLGLSVFIILPIYTYFLPEDYSDLNKYSVIIVVFFPILNLTKLANILLIKYKKNNLNLYLTIIFGAIKVLLFYTISISSGLGFYIIIVICELLLVISKFITINLMLRSDN